MTISKLPRNVYHEFRKNKGKKFLFGEVIDEVFIDQKSTRQGDYRKMLQLIKRTDGRKEIRLCYYVKDSGKPEKDYHWGSQTTFQLGIKDFKRLLKKAKRKRIL